MKRMLRSPVLIAFALLTFSQAGALALFDIPDAPVAPAVTTSQFQVTFTALDDPPTTVYLEERPSGQNWVTLGSTAGTRTMNLTRSTGTYEYRVRALIRFFHNPYEPDVEVVYSPVTVVTVAGPPIALDDFGTQVEYAFTVRAGEWNGDGLTDLYITRLNGNPDNGVFSETLLQQGANGRFTVLPPNAGMYGVAAAWPEINVNTRATDGNLDGYMDLEVWNFPAGTNIQYPQTVYSTGQPYTRNAKSVSTADEDVQMFLRDLEAASRDRDYFNDAGEPDEPGYRIDLVLEYGYCISFWWFPICASYSWTIHVGDFSLVDLGLASSAPSSSDGVQKLSASSVGSMPSSKATAISGSIAQKAATTVNVSTVGGSALPSSYVGSATQKAQAVAQFGLQNPWPDTLVCVIWCGYEIYFFNGGYEYFAWYDRWTPITIPGSFDHANYSETAFQFMEGEWDWQEILKNGQQAGGRGAISEALRRIFNIGIGVDPEPVEIDTDGTVLDPETWEAAARGAAIIIQRMKNRLLCMFKDDEECLAAIEDDILEDWDGEGPIIGVLGPGDFNEDSDWLRDTLPLMGATIQAVSKPGRWQCSYLKENLGKGLFYYGITSTVASGSCVDAVARRSATHDRTKRFKDEGTWQPSKPDAQTNAGHTVVGLGDIIARGVIRGREQQLIDSHVWLYPGGNFSHGLDDDRHMFNRIRSIARENDLGCPAWLASTATAQILSTSRRPNPAGPYTGNLTCPGAPTP
ncbi:MAG: hypothetical protein OEM85_16445 [Gammaproteobacteria bacterium]|nr:hypothetical protein [Gammaproteobacteria bacterium]